MRARPRILIICDYFLPGFESGGAVRTLANLIERLGHDYEFFVITRDHDGTAVRTPYATVVRGEWNEVANARVYYLRPEQVRAGHLAALIRETAPEVVYLNSFFSRLTIIVLALLRLKRIRQVPIVLAPEGEFSPGALSLGRVKKSAYIRAARPILLSRKIIWKAASAEEHADIGRVIGTSANVLVAPNMPPNVMFPEFYDVRKPDKAEGSARMVFLSRFMRKKNFNWLFQVLPRVTGELDLDIFGTLEEPDYVAEFERLAQQLPSNVRTTLRGVVQHEQVCRTLFSYDFFVLPTLGENFGHVVIEALAAGCPVMISDRTPWTRLEEKRIGWDLPLESPDMWLEAMNKAVHMTAAEHDELSRNARRWAENWLADPAIEGSNVQVFKKALGRD